MKQPIPDAALDDRPGFVSHAAKVRMAWDDLIEPTKIDCAYVAGFFDGEGTVNIARITRHDLRGPSYTLNVICGQASVDPLSFIQARWGGSIHYRDLASPRRGHYVWSSHANAAAKFLIEILPSLIVKRERAMLAINFQAIKSGQGKRRLRQEQSIFYAKCFADMRTLNLRGRQEVCQ